MVVWDKLSTQNSLKKPINTLKQTLESINSSCFWLDKKKNWW